jgi:RNA polymerase sigma-70 factor (ECF subfamily)
MNELDLIRTFRAETPEPSAGATARARRAWEPGERRAWRPRERRVRRRSPGRLALAGCVVAAAAAAAAVIVPGGDDSRLGAPAARAAQTLRHAAAAQTSGLTRPLRPGEYWYVRTRQEQVDRATPEQGGFRFSDPTIREDWYATDGYRGVRTHSAGPLEFPTPRDRARWEAAGRPEVSLGRDGQAFGDRPRPGSPRAERPFNLADEDLSYADLQALPRDPGDLYERLRAAARDCGCGPSVEAETFNIVADLLRDAPITNDLRAALLRAAALVPGIEFVERERDVSGRAGVGVVLAGPGTRHALVFDPGSYTLLGENEGSWGSAWLDSGVVDSPEATP